MMPLKRTFLNLKGDRGVVLRDGSLPALHVSRVRPLLLFSKGLPAVTR
jgi:hypothetical protein